MTTPKPKQKAHPPQQQPYTISPILPPQKGLFTFYAEQQQVDQYSSYAEKERMEMERLREKQKQRERSRRMLELERKRYQEMREREVEEQRIVEMKVWKIRGKERERNQLRDVLKDMKIKKEKNRDSVHKNNQSINLQKQYLSKSYKDKQHSKTKKNKTKSKHKNKERSKSTIKKQKNEITKFIKSTQNLELLQQFHKNEQAFNSNTINFKKSAEEINQQIKQQIVSNYKTKQRQPKNKMQQYIAEQIQQNNQKQQENCPQDPCAQFLRKIRQRKLNKSPNTSLSVVDITKKSVQKQVNLSIQNKEDNEDKFNQLLYPKNSLQYELNNKLYQSKDKSKLRIKSHISQKQKVQQTGKKDQAKKVQDVNQKKKIEIKDQIFDKRTYQKKIRSLSTRKRLYTELPKQHGQTLDMNVKQNFYGNVHIQAHKNQKVSESAPPTSKFTANPGHNSNINLINVLTQSQNPNTHQAYFQSSITEINNPISPPSKQFIGSQLRNCRTRTYEDQLQCYNNSYHQKQRYAEEERQRVMREREQLEFSQHLRTIRNSQKVNLMSNRNLQISVGSYDDNHSYTRKIICQSLKLPIMRNVRLSKQLQKISEVAEKKINEVIPIKRYDSIKSKKSTKKILKNLVPNPGSSSMPKKGQGNQPSQSQPQPDHKKRLVTQNSAQHQMQSLEKQQRIALIDLSKHDLISNENQKSDLSWKERKKMLFKKLGLKF